MNKSSKRKISDHLFVVQVVKEAVSWRACFQSAEASCLIGSSAMTNELIMYPEEGMGRHKNGQASSEHGQERQDILQKTSENP